MIRIRCLHTNDMRLYHFLPKWPSAALNVSLADKEKLLLGSSLSTFETISSIVDLEIWILVELSGWCSRSSLSDFQNFSVSLPFLALEPIQLNQNFSTENVNPAPSLFTTSNLSDTVITSGISVLVGSVSSCDHNPALVIYTNKNV